MRPEGYAFEWHYTLREDWPPAHKRAIADAAHKALAVTVLDCFRDGGVGIVRYHGVEERPAREGIPGLIDCYLRVTIEPYREAG